MADYNRAIKELDEIGETSLKVSGNSMSPLIKTRSALVLKKFDAYRVGDAVLCKVKGNIYVHKITQIDAEGRYLISNNKGHDNGWTKNVYGRVVNVNGKEFGRKDG
jgi:phage repressor protein C with HTH and peptisase S24 domain